MPGDEIEVPKELREFMLEKAKETILGQKNGAEKQYRKPALLGDAARHHAIQRTGRGARRRRVDDDP